MQTAEHALPYGGVERVVVQCRSFDKDVALLEVRQCEGVCGGVIRNAGWRICSPFSSFCMLMALSKKK